VKSDVEIAIESDILVFMPLISMTYVQGWLQFMLECGKIVYCYSLRS
jgi:hypothetical protein